MPFRLKAFGLHLLGSACALTLVLGTLYLGWYRWPGWYLTNVVHIVAIMLTVDLALGPLLTLVIASPKKPTRELARDIGIIATVQLAALLYGATTLWQGRPLYYTFSADRLEFVQASDLDPQEIVLARQQNPAFAPEWYSLPRWIWAPLPSDESTRGKIMGQVLFGKGPDVIQLPRYFKPWEQGLPELRKRLKKVDDLAAFTKPEKETLKQRLQQLGYAPDAPITLFLVNNRTRPLLAVFDTTSPNVKALIKAD